jgi:hypothetical protein
LCEEIITGNPVTRQVLDIEELRSLFERQPSQVEESLAYVGKKVPQHLGGIWSGLMPYSLAHSL